MRLQSLILFLAAFFCASIIVSAQTVRQIGSIRIQPSVVERDATVRTVEFLSSKRQSIGKYRGADASSCLKNLLEKIAPVDRSKAIIIAKNKAGQELAFSLPELLPDISKITPILIDRKVVGDLTDTARIGDIPGQAGRVNVKELDAYLERAAQERINLQITDVQRVVSFLRRPVSLIFPTDISPGRWLSDVETISVIIIE